MASSDHDQSPGDVSAAGGLRKLKRQEGAWVARDALRAERVTREELLYVLRSGGVADPANVASVVLTTDGSFSGLEAGAEAATLRDVEGAESVGRR